jgi:hypothetical protein
MSRVPQRAPMTRAFLASAATLVAISGAAFCTTNDSSALTASHVENQSPGALAGDSVVESWNTLGLQIAVAEDNFLTFKGHRALAMMHLAMHDALNSIMPRFARYAYSGPRVSANPVLAAAQAAHDVLVAQYGDQRAKLDAQLAFWRDSVPNGPDRTRAIALGQATAAAVLARRANDGWDFQGSYAFRDAPGQYRTTPPWKGFVAQPGFRFAKPFALESPNQFRPSPPPGLGGTVYAAAYNEVREFGDTASRRRTADQTGLAIWWMEFPEASVRRLAGRLSIERGLDPWASARLFAQLGMVLFDGYVAVWDGKYQHNQWRPYTAIRQAAHDGNGATAPDSTWQPLRQAPPTPDYPSAHAAGCAASFEVLRRALGDQSFTMTTVTAPAGMPSRSFGSFGEAAAECAESRVWLGFHFRPATDAGLVLGRNVARHVVERFLRPG